jgi:5'/3'-nucleotidase SurE
MRSRYLAAIVLAAMAHPAFALNIVLSNDDGLTSNVKALYEALKSKGHDVIVSVPCTGQSGMGGAVYFFKPLTPLTSACLNGAAAVGDPGVGKMTKAGFTGGDYHYVNGTPIMSMLYGIDVLGMARWGKLPDLVLSGPNEGQNVGAIVNSSGTIGNAQNAAARGLPAIALSADSTTADNTNLANANSPVVANLTLTLLDALAAKAGTGALFPTGMALNVNFPKDLTNAKWAFSRIGTYNAYKVKFVDDLGNDPVAAAYGLASQIPPAKPVVSDWPGVTVEMNTSASTASQAEDESVVYKSAIAVTAMQVAFDHRPAGQQWLRLRLRDLLNQ